MIERINNYYQLPVSRQLLKHFQNELGFVGNCKKVFDDLRETSGSTQVHADNCGMTLKQYNLTAGIVGQKCVMELIRLAEIGLKSTEN